jgi:opacity protein-like surface antigen
MISVKKVLLAGISAAILLASVSVNDSAAQDRNRLFGYHGFGPRVGLSIDPDQVFFGGHIDFGEAFPHVRFQPNIEFGFGDDITLIQADADFHYRFLDSWDVWNPYLGGGVGMAHWSFDSNIEGVDDSSTEFQIHAVGGIEKYISSGKFFVESKIGVVDESPDLKFLAGWTFFR